MSHDGIRFVSKEEQERAATAAAHTLPREAVTPQKVRVLLTEGKGLEIDCRLRAQRQLPGEILPLSLGVRGRPLPAGSRQSSLVATARLPPRRNGWGHAWRDRSTAAPSSALLRPFG